jgi:hypothetical protein
MLMQALSVYVRHVLQGCRALAAVGALILVPALAATGQVRDLHDPACGFGAARQLYAPRAFFGYACRDEACASHKAGFAWADRGGIADPEACREAEDDAFNEGCRAFADDAVTAEQAGFEWARENEVVDACLCGGAGPRFEAGCEAYVAGFAQ